MKIDYNIKSTFLAYAWVFNKETSQLELNNHKAINIETYNQDFINKITVVEGYESADEAVGGLFYSTDMWRVGASATFLILNTGRIWWIDKNAMEGTHYIDIIMKLVNNQEAVREIPTVATLKAAIDLIL